MPCDQAHDLEVFADCFAAFRRYVGKPYGDSVLDVFYYSPTKQSWSMLGDRTITCRATHPKRQLTESVKGSKR